MSGIKVLYGALCFAWTIVIFTLVKQISIVKCNVFANKMESTYIVVRHFKTLGLYLHKLIIGHKLCNMLSVRNKIRLQNDSQRQQN